MYEEINVPHSVRTDLRNALSTPDSDGASKYGGAPGSLFAVLRICDSFVGYYSITFAKKYWGYCPTTKSVTGQSQTVRGVRSWVIG